MLSRKLTMRWAGQGASSQTRCPASQAATRSWPRIVNYNRLASKSWHQPEGSRAMKAKIIVKVEREAALGAIRTLDALGAALGEDRSRWPKQLRRRYKQARGELVSALGWWAKSHGL